MDASTKVLPKEDLAISNGNYALISNLVATN